MSWDVWPSAAGWMLLYFPRWIWKFSSYYVLFCFIMNRWCSSRKTNLPNSAWRIQRSPRRVDAGRRFHFFLIPKWRNTVSCWSVLSKMTHDPEKKKKNPNMFLSICHCFSSGLVGSKAAKTIWLKGSSGVFKIRPNIHMFSCVNG